MLRLRKKDPTTLWISLGTKFFSDSFKTVVDYQLGDRRFVSLGNMLTIDSWPREWEGKALFEAVGYSPKGYKMNELRKTYVNEVKWKTLKSMVKKSKKKGFSAQGMNFEMSFEKKGGCLSSLHIVRNRGETTLFIHGKIAEIPRKFVADLLLFRDLLHELGLWPIKVVMMYSTMYYSIVGLRAYLPILGIDNMNLHDLPILEGRNYQAGIIEAIERKRQELSEEFGFQIITRGAIGYLDLKRGNWYE